MNPTPTPGKPAKFTAPSPFLEKHHAYRIQKRRRHRQGQCLFRRQGGESHLVVHGRFEKNAGPHLSRRIPVHELAENSTFEEVVFLLWNRRLPKAQELEDFKKKLAAERKVSDPILSMLREFPKKSHPMGVLRTMTSVLGLFDPEGDNIDGLGNQRKAIRLTAAFPILIAAFHRLREGKNPVAPDPALSHAANFLFMIHGKPPEKG